MKNFCYIIMSFLILSCNNSSKKVDNSKYYIQQDPLLIRFENGEYLKFSKKDFNKIIDKHPEFFQDIPENPDRLYYRFANDVDFGSEQGQDTYYALYAYFLKDKNGNEKYIQQRKQLIEIYLAINSLFQYLQYNGSYFGHQRTRILGYAEYSIYLLPKDKNEIEKTYNISKQKQLYIQSLRQLIEDESKIDNETLGKEKIERTKKLNEIVDKLDELITDNFYLRRAQNFQYENYEYY